MAGVQEGGLKRSFANLGSEDAAAQAAARRPHINSAATNLNPLGAEESVDVSMSPARQSRQEEGLTSADIPIAGKTPFGFPIGAHVALFSYMRKQVLQAALVIKSLTAIANAGHAPLHAICRAFRK